jgi:hypothetical protein
VRHEIVVADESVAEHPDSWSVRCSCGWKTKWLMPELAADEVAAMHREHRAEMLAFGEKVREACRVPIDRLLEDLTQPGEPDDDPY